MLCVDSRLAKKGNWHLVAFADGRSALVYASVALRRVHRQGAAARALRRREEHHHMQPSLTECVVRDARELPCVACEHGYLFSLASARASCT